MKKINKPIALLTLVFLGLAMIAISTSGNTKPEQKVDKKSNKKIQAAILLDVSNSMDGLINQAKAQLWNMVSIMGKLTCDGNVPQIEIALYEYGRPGNGLNNGYIKQISGFTSDLDQLSKQLFSLTTDGGDEYCGKVIYNALDQLGWDSSSNNYKVIFIAGNEDFLQGDVLYTRSCEKAKLQGVIVNTIFCGDKMQGIREHWNLNTTCGGGSYTNINQDEEIEEISTPYDSLMLTLNENLNDTYISYGYAGVKASEDQKQMDKENYKMSKSVAVKRVEVKAKKELYKNDRWDLVDATAKDEKFIEKIDMKHLPDSLQHKQPAELKKFVEQKKNERSVLQDEIGKIAIKRENYIANERSKKVTAENVSTLESEIEKIIKKQAILFNLTLK